MLTKVELIEQIVDSNIAEATGELREATRFDQVQFARGVLKVAESIKAVLNRPRKEM